jgi:hypothetical protein
MKKTRNRGRRKNTRTHTRTQREATKAGKKKVADKQENTTSSPCLLHLQKCRKLETGEGEKEHT